MNGYWGLLKKELKENRSAFIAVSIFIVLFSFPLIRTSETDVWEFIRHLSSFFTEKIFNTELIALEYIIGFIWVIIGLMTLKFTLCSFSHETENRTIHLLHRFPVDLKTIAAAKLSAAFLYCLLGLTLHFALLLLFIGRIPFTPAIWICFIFFLPELFLLSSIISLLADNDKNTGGIFMACLCGEACLTGLFYFFILKLVICFSFYNPFTLCLSNYPQTFLFPIGFILFLVLFRIISLILFLFGYFKMIFSWFRRKTAVCEYFDDPDFGFDNADEDDTDDFDKNRDSVYFRDSALIKSLNSPQESLPGDHLNFFENRNDSDECAGSAGFSVSEIKNGRSIDGQKPDSPSAAPQSCFRELLKLTFRESKIGISDKPLDLRTDLILFIIAILGALLSNRIDKELPFIILFSAVLPMMLMPMNMFFSTKPAERNYGFLNRLGCPPLLYFMSRTVPYAVVYGIQTILLLVFLLITTTLGASISDQFGSCFFGGKIFLAFSYFGLCWMPFSLLCWLSSFSVFTSAGDLTFKSFIYVISNIILLAAVLTLLIFFETTNYFVFPFRPFLIAFPFMTLIFLFLAKRNVTSALRGRVFTRSV